jgi:hypothetical protein
MVLLHVREVDKRILPSFVDKNVWKRALADLTLELAPVDACEVDTNLRLLFCLQPALETHVMDEFNSTPALADLEQRIVIVVLRVPAKTALRDVFAFVAHILLLLFFELLLGVFLFLLERIPLGCFFECFGLDLLNTLTLLLERHLILKFRTL